MAIFGTSFLDSIIEWIKKRYKFILTAVLVLILGTSFVIYKNESRNNDQIKFTEQLICLQDLESKKDFKEMRKILSSMKSLYLNTNQELLIEFYENKINLKEAKPQVWKTSYISRVNQFKDPNYTDGFLGESINNLISKYKDASFSSIGELSLIMRLEDLIQKKKVQEAKNFIMEHKAQGLPNYLLWYSFAKNLAKYDEHNARLYLLQIVLYSKDYLPANIFKSSVAKLLLSLKKF